MLDSSQNNQESEKVGFKASKNTVYSGGKKLRKVDIATEHSGCSFPDYHHWPWFWALHRNQNLLQVPLPPREARKPPL